MYCELKKQFVVFVRDVSCRKWNLATHCTLTKVDAQYRPDSAREQKWAENCNK